MKLTFIGHQSWLVTQDQTHILVDPVLFEGIGNSGSLSLPIFPPRKVAVKELPSPDLVLITHEHPDHFDLASLATLAGGTRVAIGATMPRYVEEAILALGLRCETVPWGEPVRVHALEMRCYPANQRTPVWENRVVQPLFSAAGKQGPTAFIAVDALVSDQLILEVRSGQVPPPACVVISNNSQIPPSPAYDNLLEGPRWKPRLHVRGIELLKNLKYDLCADLGEAQQIVLCGNGFRDPRQCFGPFLLSNNADLASMANSLDIGGPEVIGPDPGQVIEVGRPFNPKQCVDWIEIDDSERTRQLLAQASFLKSPGRLEPLRPVSSCNLSPSRLILEMEAGLSDLARSICLTSLGHSLASTQSHLGRPLDGRRFLLRLMRHEAATLQFALDVRDGQFHPMELGVDEPLRAFPFGAELFLCDLHAVQTGVLSPWDIAGVGIRCWYVGSPYNSLTNVLFRAYGEHVRPDLARRATLNRVNELLHGSTIRRD